MTALSAAVAMHRLAFLMLCVTLCSASPAWAMRGHDYIDADQRVPVSLPGEQATTVITLAPQLEVAEAVAADAAQLPTREQAQAVAQQPVASPVPEPSGIAMLGLGMLLLLLKPYKRDGEAIARDPEKYSTL